MKFLIAILLGQFCLVCAAQTKFNYDLNKPDKQYQLPSILNEVSGLTDVDSTTVACVQDELGIIFIYDFVNGQIVSQHRFDSTGDFEGLTYAEKSLYILRSDGRLTEWNNFPENSKSVKHYKLPLLTSNNEGLCFDPKSNSLLIAAKSKPVDHDKKSERLIYKYDLATKKLQTEPAYSVNVEWLSVKARDMNIQQTETNPKGEKKPFNFRPASLSVHPVSNDIYIISAADKLLIIMDRNGDVKHLEQMRPELFLKPEGITFLNDGTMIITNEAAGKTPTLFVFKMKH